MSTVDITVRAAPRSRVTPRKGLVALIALVVIGLAIVVVALSHTSSTLATRTQHPSPSVRLPRYRLKSAPPAASAAQNAPAPTAPAPNVSSEHDGILR
jgi:hypothetical protein